jgi:hypothetical protein
MLLILDSLKAIFGLQNTERLQFEIAVDFKGWLLYVISVISF